MPFRYGEEARVTVQHPGFLHVSRLRCLLPTLAMSLTLIAGCASPVTDSTHHPPNAQIFPHFSDWRVAYIGQDSDLHLISLDGKTNLVGPHLPTDGPQGTGLWTAGASPDGEHLVYSDDGLEYIDIRQDRLTHLPTYAHGAIVLGTILWSPDGHAVAVDGPIKGAAVVHLPSGSVSLAPSDNTDAAGKLIAGSPYGWINNTSLAIEDASIEDQSAGGGRVPTPQTIASMARLDVANGQLQPIVTLRFSTMGQGQFSLAPDGNEAIFFNSAFQSFPFTPSVDRIDVATGQTTPLPNLASALPTSGGFTQLLWLPHSHMALVATGYPQDGNLAYQIIDIDHDSVVPLALSGFPVAWSPDGTTLILASSDQASNDNGVGFHNVGVIGSGPYTLTSVTFDSGWHVVKSATLTTHAIEIPTLGFVRNP